MRELAKSGGPAFGAAKAFDTGDGGAGAGRPPPTETVQHQDQVLESPRDHLVEMFMQAPGFIAVLDGPTHVIQRANTAYLRLVGSDEIEGRPIREALPERLNETAYALACDVVTSDGRHSQTELRMLQEVCEELKIDRLHAAAIEWGARVRHMGV